MFRMSRGRRISGHCRQTVQVPADLLSRRIVLNIHVPRLNTMSDRGPPTGGIILVSVSDTAPGWLKEGLSSAGTLPSQGHMDRHQYIRPQREKSQLQMCYANYPKSSKSPCPLNGAGVHGSRNETRKHEISEAME